MDTENNQTLNHIATKIIDKGHRQQLRKKKNYIPKRKSKELSKELSVNENLIIQKENIDLKTNRYSTKKLLTRKSDKIAKLKKSKLRLLSWIYKVWKTRWLVMRH